MAIIYHEDGDFEAALALYIRVLMFREQTFGPDTLDTLMVSALSPSLSFPLTRLFTYSLSLLASLVCL